MAGTPYTSVNDIFQSQISDSIFNGLANANALMQRYLLNSIPKFKRCKQDLTQRDDINMTFNITLTDEEQLILGTLMVIEYYNPLINTIELMKQSMSTKDYSITSQAQHLKQLLDLRKDKMAEVQKLIVDYTYNNNDLTGLK